VSSIHDFGPFRLDAAERLLLRMGQPVSLTPKTFDVLLHLVERHGRLVTKQELLSAVWPDTFVEEANLTYTVSTLRKALGDGHEGEQFIQTVPTRGYRFVASVSHARDAAVSDRTASFPRNRLSRFVSITLALAVVAMLPVVVRHLREGADAPVPAPAKLTIPVPDTAVGAASGPVVQISPDGRNVAFILGSDPRRLWIRKVGLVRAAPVAGTDGARSLFWSPDGQSLAFTTESALKKLTVSDGTVETLCETCSPGRGGSWSRSGLILFTSNEGGLLGIPAAGGAPKAVTSLDRSAEEAAHIAPHFLPDGHRFLYLVRKADASRSGLYVGQVGSAERRLLLQGQHPALYAAPGYLLLGPAVSWPSPSTRKAWNSRAT
jgi:DNA-binding winged helix-turn-helix (wHTH) protein